MNRIDSIFASFRKSNRKALMPFLCGGHPTPASLPALLAAISAVPDAPIVEVGIPFSDPIADGPIIAAAMHNALALGVTPRRVFEQVGLHRAATAAKPAQLGIVAMMSISLVTRIGEGEVIAMARANGIDGFIFPDLPVDEAEPLIAKVRSAGLIASLLVAPSTSHARAERIVHACSGFVYLLARAGITGESAAAPTPNTPDVLADRIAALRSMTDLPIACGFGISSAANVRSVVHPARSTHSPTALGADAAIVGSLLVRHLTAQADINAPDPAVSLQSLVQNLCAGLHPV